MSVMGTHRRWWAPGRSARAGWRAWRRGDVDEAERLAALAGPLDRAGLLYLTNVVRGRMRVDLPVRADLDRVTALPFADHPLAPYLSAVEATLDGHRLLAHIDTGGPFVVMGTARAEALGIPLVPMGRQRHGVTRTEAASGVASELRLGDATLTDVPVTAMPTLRDEQDVVIIGTGVLRRFLATVDHPGRRLLLSPRLDPAATADHLALLGHLPEVARIPFYLWGDHYMFARGGFGSRRNLNFFIDSGFVYLADDDTSPSGQAALYTTAQRYRSWGVPTRVAAGPHFRADRPLWLGPLRQDDQLVATAPTRRVPWAAFGGVRVDGLLSNGFLANYAWTLDFDRHEYTFRQPT